MKNELKFSFEFFPTKNASDEDVAWKSLKKLESFNPEFFSVTFGAGGGERLKTDTFVKKINKDSNVPVAGHLTCVDMTKDEINDLALGWFEKGIKRIVALRGDVRTEGAKYHPHPQGYENAADMVAGLKKLANFDISVAGYPEIHPDSIDKKNDLDNLKRKVDAGADRIITQFFFDENVFYVSEMTPLKQELISKSFQVLCQYKTIKELKVLVINAELMFQNGLKKNLMDLMIILKFKK